MAEGRKDDKGKVRWSLLPTGTVRAIVEVLEVGAKKYDVDNWKKVPDARTRYYDAMMRHIEAWWGGQALDPEDNLHHLAHAGCCLLFLLWLDRPAAAEIAAASEAPITSDGWIPWNHEGVLPAELVTVPAYGMVRVMFKLSTGGRVSRDLALQIVDWRDPSIIAFKLRP